MRQSDHEKKVIESLRAMYLTERIWWTGMELEHLLVLLSSKMILLNSGIVHRFM